MTLKLRTSHTRFYLLFILSLAIVRIQAQTIRGTIRDAVSNETLDGATVSLKNETQQFTQIAGFDGSYIFKNIPAGKYTLSVSFIGYETAPTEIAISDSNTTTKELNIQLFENKNILTEVTIKGQGNKETEEFARKREITVPSIMNIVSAKAIELSPDVTVGNVMQRVSGITMTRSSGGDGQFAIIRGLPTRYTYTSINGIIMPSPDAQTRSVPLDMFPVDLIQRVEVTKGLLPNVEANAIGGAVNLIMKDAPTKLIVSGNFSTGYSTIFADQKFSGFSKKDISFQSPTEINGNKYLAKVSDFNLNHLNFTDVSLPLNLNMGLTVGNSLFKGKMGYLVGGSYIRDYRGGNTLLFTGQSTSTNNTPYYPAEGGTPTPNSVVYTALENRQYSYLQSRLGLHGKLDFNISDDHSIKLYGLFLQLDDNQHRYYVRNGISNTASEVDYFDRVQFVRKNITNVSLIGSDKIAQNLSADWTLSYAIATSKTPDWTDLGRFKDSAASSTLYLSNPLTIQWLHSQDNYKAGYLNFKYTLLQNIELFFGGFYRTEDRSSYYTSYKLSPIIPGLARQTYTDINSAVFSFNPSLNAIGDTTNAQSYSATEDISGAYTQAKVVLLEKLQIVGGARLENTHQTWLCNISETLPFKSGDVTYADILPSVSFKYALSNKSNLRLSYYGGISRPNVYELIPLTAGGDVYSSGGNPKLKHTTSQNIDFRYENFFSTTSNILLGVFYKNLSNAIETAFDNTINSNSATLLPTNPTGNVIDYGAELVFTKFIRKFGISGNYTYIHSAVTTLKQLSQRDASGQVKPILIDQTRPMQGQADNIANLSLLYKDATSGFDAQLSFVYNGKRIAVVSSDYGLDQWQRATFQMDFSANQKIGTHVVVFVKATNLLNNSIYLDILSPNGLYTKGIPDQTDANRVLVQRDLFKTAFQLGFRYKL